MNTTMNDQVRGGAEFRIEGLPANMRAKIMPGDNGCWEWLGAVQSSGYGSITNGAGSSSLTHRVAYETIVGEIPKRLTIDHLCLNKICVNTDHMEVVTRGENSKRKNRAQTHCKRGHELSGENIRLQKRGSWIHRTCLACLAFHKANSLARRRAEVAA